MFFDWVFCPIFYGPRPFAPGIPHLFGDRHFGRLHHLQRLWPGILLPVAAGAMGAGAVKHRAEPGAGVAAGGNGVWPGQLADSMNFFNPELLWGLGLPLGLGLMRLLRPPRPLPPGLAGGKKSLGLRHGLALAGLALCL